VVGLDAYNRQLPNRPGESENRMQCEFKKKVTMDERLKALINGLIGKCEEEKVNWEKKGRYKYKLSLSEGRIVILIVNPPYFDSSYCLLEIYNDKELMENIISCKYNSDNEAYFMLKKLYDCANKSYFKIDETYQTVFKEIEESELIGKMEEK
jgi:hypothetical protein